LQGEHAFVRQDRGERVAAEFSHRQVVAGRDWLLGE